MASLQQLKNTAFKGEDLEQLMALAAFANNLRQEYDKRNVPEPDFLAARITELGREIAMRTDDAKQKRIRELLAQKQALMSTTEKKKSIDEELAALQAAL